MKPWLFIGIAGYALVVGAGLIGILVVAESGEAGQYVTAWLGFAGVGGMVGAVLGQVAGVKGDVEKLTNGELEKAVRHGVGIEVAKFAAREQIEREGRRWQPPKPT